MDKLISYTIYDYKNAGQNSWQLWLTACTRLRLDVLESARKSHECDNEYIQFFVVYILGPHESVLTILTLQKRKYKPETYKHKRSKSQQRSMIKRFSFHWYTSITEKVLKTFYNL
jgi:hypothetical protein